jgi:hypothetical protein
MALAAFPFIGKIIILTYPDKVVNHILIEANQPSDHIIIKLAGKKSIMLDYSAFIVKIL